MKTTSNEKLRIPLSAVENTYTKKDLLSGSIPTEKFFSVFMDDNSMSPRIDEGDTLIIRKQSTYENDKISLILVNNDDLLVRRVQIHPNGIILSAFNSAIDSLFVFKDQIENESIRILGRVVEVRSYFINGVI